MEHQKRKKIYFQDYLFYKEINGTMRFKPYCKMKTHNDFLDELNDNMGIIKERKIDVTIIAGTGEKTIDYLQIVPSTSQNMWVDGRVVDFTTSMDGDGNAIVNSVFLLEGEKYIIHGSHINILYKCEHILRKKLLVEESMPRGASADSTENMEVLVSLLIQGSGKIYLRLYV